MRGKNRSKGWRVKNMRILMLGNSFTFANHMPETLAELTGAEVVQHTRGGATSGGAAESGDENGEGNLGFFTK